MIVRVNLTPAEMEIAARVGCSRKIDKMLRGRPDFNGASTADAWTLDIEGAAGEMAVAKYTGTYWTGNFGNLKADDVGELQVRTSRYPNARLILHDKDPDDRAFVLVTGVAPAFTLCGWIWGRDGKRPEFIADPTGNNRPAYFVPQESLNPMDGEP